MNYKIAVLNGDGIGPEIVAETIKVLDEVEKGIGLSKTFDSIDELTEDLQK